MARRRLVLACLLAAVGCGPREAPPPATPATLADVAEAFDTCRDGDLDAGLGTLDGVLERSPRDPDALVARGLCRWARWSGSGARRDIRDAYRDLSEAIASVDDGAQPGTPLDQIYSHRAFVAQALDDGWTRALADLDRAVALDPADPTHALDRGVVHAYAGDTVAARADLGRFLDLADSADVDRQRVAEALLADLAPPLPAR